MSVTYKWEEDFRDGKITAVLFSNCCKLLLKVYTYFNIKFKCEILSLWWHDSCRNKTKEKSWQWDMV